MVRTNSISSELNKIRVECRDLVFTQSGTKTWKRHHSSKSWENTYTEIYKVFGSINGLSSVPRITTAGMTVNQGIRHWVDV